MKKLILYIKQQSKMYVSKNKDHINTLFIDFMLGSKWYVILAIVIPEASFRTSISYQR
jgi:hypothetical protein